jgi:hypothetical protein
VKKNSHDRGGELAGTRIELGLMPLIDPIHHAEKAKDGDTRIETGGEVVSHDFVEDLPGQGKVAALNGADFVAKGLFERIFFVGEDLHLVGMGEEVFDVVLD